jgi:dTDP-glucose pyrophosphorylase
MKRTVERLKSLCVERTGLLRDVLVKLEAGGAEIVLVVEHERLHGVITDGDVRRALLRGATLESPLHPYIVTNCVTVSPVTSRAEVLDLMNARRITQVPIIDGDQRLVGMHLLHDMLGASQRPNLAVVMCGGRGTRLAPLTNAVPKPMLKVAGRPILERIVLHLVGFGVRRIALAVNYLASQIEEHFDDGDRFGAQITYLHEDKPLGTAGALSLLPETPDSPIIVMNGDLVTQFSVAEMFKFHEVGGQMATMGVRRYFHTVPFGCIELDGNLVKTLEEKPTITRLVNTGIYIMNPSLLGRIPKGVEYHMPHLLEDSLRRSETVRAFEIVDDWIDVGQRDQLRQAREGGL